MELKKLNDYTYPREKDMIRINIPLSANGIINGLMYRLKYGYPYKPYWKVLKECVLGEKNEQS